MSGDKRDGKVIARLRSIKRKEGVITWRLVLSEIFRWLVIACPVLLSVWRYAEMCGYYHFIPGIKDVRGQFWGMVVLIFLLGSLFIYLPAKVLTVLYCIDARKINGWRPSIIQYVLTCALPCFTLILVAAKSKDLGGLDPSTIATLQVVVMGLTATEWAAKLREEQFNYCLVTDMGNDFFFAFDTIEMLQLATYKEAVFRSYWVYVTFAASFISMFKFVPVPPNVSCDNVTSRGAVTSVFVTLFCQDVPFLIIRLIIMISYGMDVSDLIHPIKNVAYVIINVLQLWFIFKRKPQCRRQGDVMKCGNNVTDVTVLEATAGEDNPMKIMNDQSNNEAPLPSQCQQLRLDLV